MSITAGRAARARRVAVADEHDVDVARVVELVAAELAHADDGQRRRLAGQPPGRRRARRRPVRPSARTDRLEPVVEPEQVARRDAQELEALPRARARVGVAGVERRPPVEVGEHVEGARRRVTSRRRSASGWRRSPRRARRASAGVGVEPRRRSPACASDEPLDRAPRTGGGRGRALDGLGRACGRHHAAVCQAGESGADGPRSLRRVARLRVAAVPAQHRRRRPRRQRRAHRSPRSSEAEAAGCDVAAFPELAITGYPPEDLAAEAGVRRRQPRGARARWRPRTGRCAAVVGFVDAGRDLLQRRRGLRRRRGAGHLPQAAAAQLRRVRRAAVLRARHRAARAVRHRRRAGRACRSARTPGAPTGPIAEQAAGGAELVVNLNASPYYAGRLGERERMLADPGRRRRRARSSTSTRSAARTSWSSTAPRWSSTPTASSLARGAAVRRGTSLVVDLDVRPVFRKRLLDPRGRASARRCPRSSSPSEPRPTTIAASRRRAPSRSTPVRGGLRGARARHARLRRARTASPTWSSGCRAASTRRSSPPSPSTRSAPSTCTACSCRRATRATDSRHRRRGAGRQPRHRPPHDRHRARPRRLPRDARARRSRAATPDLTEENLQSPHPGRAAHGAVQQVRLAGADHRQQERDGRRLLHALRRHRPAASPSSRTCPSCWSTSCAATRNARAGRERHPRGGAHQAAVGRAAARPARRPEPAALRGARPDPRGLRRGRPHRRRADRGRLRRGASCAASSASSTWPSTSAARRPPGVRVTPRRSARTAACRSPTATAADPPPRDPPWLPPSSPETSASAAARAIILDAVELTVAPGHRIGIVGPNGVGQDDAAARARRRARSPTRARSRWRRPTATVGYLPQEPDRRAGETVPRLPRPAHRRGRRHRRARGRDASASPTARRGRRALRRGPRPLAGARRGRPRRRVGRGAGPTSACRRAVLDQPTATLSGGQAARARAGGGAARRFDVFLLDEPTNDLDFAGLDRLERFVRRPRGRRGARQPRPRLPRAHGHRVVELDEHTHRARATTAAGWPTSTSGRRPGGRPRRRTGLRRAGATACASGPGASGRGRAGRGPGREAPDDNDKNIRHCNIQSAESSSPASAKRTERALERLDGGRQAVGGLGAATARSAAAAAQRRRRGPPGRRGRRARARSGSGPVDLEIGWADRVAIVGPNGAGKTTLLGALLGRLPLAAGERWLGPGRRGRRARPGPAPARPRARPLLDGVPRPRPGWTVRRGPHAAGQVRPRRRRTSTGPSVALSPGERTRALLALLPARGVNCLVLDEPTNHLDLPAIEQLEQALEAFEGTLLLVTHDRQLLEAVEVDRVLDVADGQVARAPLKRRCLLGLAVARLGDEVPAGPLGHREALDERPELRPSGRGRPGGRARGRSRSRATHPGRARGGSTAAPTPVDGVHEPHRLRIVSDHRISAGAGGRGGGRGARPGRSGRSGRSTSRRAKRRVMSSTAAALVGPTSTTAR